MLHSTAYQNLIKKRPKLEQRQASLKIAKEDKEALLHELMSKWSSLSQDIMEKKEDLQMLKNGKPLPSTFSPEMLNLNMRKEQLQANLTDIERKINDTQHVISTAEEAVILYSKIFEKVKNFTS